MIHFPRDLRYSLLFLIEFSMPYHNKPGLHWILEVEVNLRNAPDIRIFERAWISGTANGIRFGRSE